MPIAARPSLRNCSPTFGPTNSTRTTSSGPNAFASSSWSLMIRSVLPVISPPPSAGPAAAAAPPAIWRSPRNLSRNSLPPPTRTTASLSMPSFCITSRIGSSPIAPPPVKRTCISVPPAKSTPSFTPGFHRPAKPIASTSHEIATQNFHFPMKSILVPGGISSRGTLGSSLDGELGHGPRARMKVVEDPRHHQRREHAGQDPDRERHREALDRSGAVLEQHQRRDHVRHVRVEDGAAGLLEAGSDRGAGRAAVAELLADALEDDHVRVDGHADRQHQPRHARHGERALEDSHQPDQRHQVRQQREARVDPREPVVADREDDHEHQAHGGGPYAAPDRVLAQRGPDRALLLDLHRDRQRARTQHHREVARLLRGEATGDLTLARDAVADHRRAV